MKKFYRKKLYPNVYGVEPQTEVWISIHETPCYHFCVTDWEYNWVRDNNKKEEETYLETAKRMYSTIKKVDKRGSRFAFETEKEAMDHLIMLKSRQIDHMSRDLAILKQFVKLAKNNEPFKNIKKYRIFDL